MNFFEELNIDFKNQTVFLDADGTLVPDGSLDFTRSVLDKISELKRKNAVFLCVNCRDRIRKNRLEEILRLSVINKKYRKPSGKIIAGLERNEPHSYVVIGDKFLTDGLFARNIGGRFIKVRRKVSGKERFINKIINFLDDLISKIAQWLKLI